MVIGTQLDANPAAARLRGSGKRRAGTAKGIEHHTFGGAKRLDEALERCNRFLRRVEPKAAILARLKLRSLTAVKNSASLGFEPGQPPSI